MKRILYVLLNMILITAFFSCVKKREKVIIIAAAANLRYVMDELTADFSSRYPGTRVKVVFGSSGKLYAQIKNNAPFDLFMSADMNYPLKLFSDSLTLDTPFKYAEGALVIFTVQDITLSGIETAASKRVESIAIANYNTAPYGKASLEALENAGLNGLEYKINNAKSVSEALQFVLIASDIGFISKSALYAASMKKYQKQKNWIEVDPALYTPLEQGIVLLKNSPNRKEAELFYTYIQSGPAREIFAGYGYR